MPERKNNRWAVTFRDEQGNPKHLFFSQREEAESIARNLAESTEGPVALFRWNQKGRDRPVLAWYEGVIVSGTEHTHYPEPFLRQID